MNTFGSAIRNDILGIILIILLISMPDIAHGQTKDTINLTKESIKYDYFEKNCNTELFWDTLIPGQNMRVFFECCYSDYVEIYLNNVVVTDLCLTTEHSTGLAYSIKINLPPENPVILKIVIPGKNVYCEINLDKKYKIVRVNRLENWDPPWRIAFTNCPVGYE